MPRVTITKELYKKVEAEALRERIPVSKLIEKLLVEGTKEKTMYRPRCAFKF